MLPLHLLRKAYRCPLARRGEKKASAQASTTSDISRTREQMQRQRGEKETRFAVSQGVVSYKTAIS
jgi:hypothetical protein